MAQGTTIIGRHVTQNILSSTMWIFGLAKCHPTSPPLTPILLFFSHDTWQVPITWKKRKEKQLFNFILFITLDKAHGPPQALP
jgi:hypothetical protein